jgi:hypothetical protein
MYEIANAKKANDPNKNKKNRKTEKQILRNRILD